MANAVIVDACRTPFGKRNGWLSGHHATELLGFAQRGILERNGLQPGDIDQLIGGCVTQAGEQSSNVTRMAWLANGFPWEIGATTVDAQCSSSQQAAHLIAGLIAGGVIEIGMATGVEAMSRIPLMSNFPGPTGSPKPPSWDLDMPNQFVGSDRIARDKGITRQDLDEFGFRSQKLAKEAWDNGHFDRAIVPVPGKTLGEGETPETVTRDQGLRDTTMEGLAALKPIDAENGLHTAGTSSQISDGASAMLMMSEERANALGLKPRARIIAQALVGGPPKYVLDGPIQATQKVFDQTGMTSSDIDLVEINEAFAAVPISFERHHKMDRDKINVNGGAIAIGHPVGATGVRLFGALIDELERRDLTRGLITICAGGSMGSAAIVERI